MDNLTKLQTYSYLEGKWKIQWRKSDQNIINVMSAYVKCPNSVFKIYKGTISMHLLISVNWKLYV